jgi:predicted dienelactone hydrolase
MRTLAILIGLVAAATAAAQPPSFVAKQIDAESEFPACAVIDVNRDGKLDIVSGGYWYEAPEWKRHFLREVEVIRGRFDDYSNLEIDVNADGWTDILSCNYRSQSLFWMEHPGEKIRSDPDTPWIKHLIDRPGPMETGRLYDIDADGDLDVLPNGTTFAAWYELTYETADGKKQPRFIRHDLPKEIAGHGVGFGDINGDGRGDIVGPRGWLEAPEDRRGGRWLWHPDWQTHRDASIPILVYDVDQDGDNDLVYGRGHSYGLYWLEQSRSRLPGGTSGGDASWQRHAIDTSWSQPHSLLLADLDGDKRLEVISGKRYFGHDGKDLGEQDLLCGYAYQFEPQSRTFRRLEIFHGLRAGLGLDPKAADIDGDGDLDLVAADRCSLMLLQNIRPGEPAQPSWRPSREPSVLYRHDAPLEVERKAGVKGPAENAEQFGLRRDHIQRGMQTVMGEFPDSSRRVPLDVKIESRDQTPDYVRIKLTYAAEPGDRVPVLLLVPKSVELAGDGVGGATGSGGKKLPAMLCLHPTNPDGKAQTAGLVGLPTRHYGHQLAQRGFVCLIPDYPSFGDYKAYDFHQKRPGSDQPLYESGSMKAIWNNVRAVDLLESLGYVDPDKIGAIGHSLGGHNALFTAVFEPRLKAVVTSCGFTAFHDYYKGDLKGWTSDRYMPKIRDVYQNNPDKMPFDFPEVLAAIAPRGVYVAAPLHDSNFENSGVKKCIAAAQPVFDLLGAKDQLVAEYPDCAHDFPDDVRERVYAWLEKQLR